MYTSLKLNVEHCSPKMILIRTPQGHPELWTLDWSSSTWKFIHHWSCFLPVTGGSEVPAGQQAEVFAEERGILRGEVARDPCR